MYHLLIAYLEAYTEFGPLQRPYIYWPFMVYVPLVLIGMIASLMFCMIWAISSSARWVLIYGLKTVAPIMNMFWSMLMTFCALAPIWNASSCFKSNIDFKTGYDW
jgi:hypothetical protein